MSNGQPKVEIPAWQRAGAQPSPSPAEDSVSRPAPAQEDPAPAQPAQDPAPAQDPSAETPSHPESPAPSSGEPESVPCADRPPAAAPPLAEEPADKARSVLQAEHFEAFLRQQHSDQQNPPQAAPVPRQPHRERPAPIITYPEFLVEAHTPPPLLTPGRVLQALYAGGAVAAVLYGASRWLITPMVETLSESRHEFYAHAHTKMHEFNQRLAQIASPLPAPASDQSGMPFDQHDGDTGDPTGLYYRHMATQTSPVPSRPPSTGADVREHLATHAHDTLATIRMHMAEMADGSEKAGESHQDCLRSVDDVRHCLDGLVYGSAGASPWTRLEDAMTTRKNDPAAREDAVEQLKKEIRSVKGVLLSAKRFPAVSRPVGAAAESFGSHGR